MNMNRRAFTRTEAVASVGMVGILGTLACLAGPPSLSPMRPTMQNLRALGQATEMYRADNAGFYPATLTYTRGTAPQPGVQMEGWATWSFGGKNSNAYWAGRGFDIEAADRPLNAYAVPNTVFDAPPIPQQMAAGDPARLRDQAPVFRDKMDRRSRQRTWPADTTPISGYDDVGTSYHFNIGWWDQSVGPMPIQQRFALGAQRMASGQGVDPARFVWLADEELDVVTFSQNRNAVIVNDYGAINTSQMLFADGHAGYHQTIPGYRQSSLNNLNYTLIFSDLPNPGRPD